MDPLTPDEVRELREAEERARRRLPPAPEPIGSILERILPELETSYRTRPTESAAE